MLIDGASWSNYCFCMAPRIPNLDKKPIPTVPEAARGTIFENVGKYARGAVLYAFEEVGGADALAEWAQSNPDEFYTKLFPKIITKEVDVNERERGIGDLLDALDGDYEVVDDGSAPSGTSGGVQTEAGGPDVEDAEVVPASGPAFPTPDDIDVDEMTEFDDG